MDFLYKIRLRALINIINKSTDTHYYLHVHLILDCD